MRKYLSLVLALMLLLSLPFASPVSAAQTIDIQQKSSQNHLLTLPAVTDFSYDFIQPGPTWQKLVAGIAPASFSQVEYQLAEDVLEITGVDTVTQKIASEGQVLAGSSLQKQLPMAIVTDGGYLSRDILDAAAAQQGRTVEIGTVVVDTARGTAFKVVSPTVHSGLYQADSNLMNQIAALQDTYAVTRPELHEIFQDFSLGGANGETIELTPGNISGFAPNIESSVVLPGPQDFQAVSLQEQYQGYKHIFGEKLVDLRFDKTLLDGQTSSGANIQVKVSGGIGIQKILVNAKYTRFSGYYFAMTLNQESYFLVELGGSLDEEVRIPICGIDADIGDVGRVTGGVFIIVGLNGELRLELAAREFASTTIGVRGKTAAYVPCSIRPVFSKTLKGEGDVNLTGDVDGYIKFGPMLGVELFGYDLVGAGAFLGTGVQVEADPNQLDIELYGILNVYIDFLSKHFDLVNWRPTFWERKQTNTAGHRVTFMESYVYPGRISGVIEKEVPISSTHEDGFMPVANLPYRVWVIPRDTPFDPVNVNDRNNPAIRKYPTSGFAQTNADGIFFQKNDTILSGGERAFIEFQVSGQSHFSSGADATLPFEKFTITQADYFNDFVVGQVQPVRLINYDVPASDTENRYEYIYYANSPVKIRPFLYVTTVSSQISTGGVAYARTDEYGYFDTRDVFIDDNGAEVPHWQFDIRPDAESWTLFDSFRIYMSLDYRNATISGEVPISATMDMNFSRTISEVPNSYKRFDIGGGRLVDQMAYDEFIYVINPNGTQTVSGDEFCYWADSFSTQDFHPGLIDYRYMPVQERDSLWRKGAPDVKTPAKKLLPVTDANGNPTGAVLFWQRVFVEWVWQAHPNPVRITSDDQYSTPSSGGQFQVTAAGYAPFAFNLDKAPPGVTIDRNTGLLQVAPGTPAATYVFTIRAEENREEYQVTLPDGQVLDQSRRLGPYEGNDPSPPDEQAFTLVVTEAADPTPKPTATPAPEPTAKPTPTTARTAPDINSAKHNYTFALTNGGRGLSIQVTATGSTPITWSLVPYVDYPFPASAAIDPRTGLLTIGSDLAAGSYMFDIRAQNDVGQDIQACSLEVSEPPAAPVIQDSEANDFHFVFIKQLQQKDPKTFTIQATGSKPITWSLEQTGRVLLPEALSIDPETGLLTIQPNIATGNYLFTIRATNTIGSDTQDCTLEVKYIFNPRLQQDEEVPAYAVRDDYRLLSSISGQANSFFAEKPQIETGFFKTDDLLGLDPSDMQLAPPNILTFRYDDPNDVYTEDRWTQNGAAYVRWQSFPGVLQRFNHMNSNFWTAGAGTSLLDTSPRCDNYHYHGPEPDSVTIAEIQEFFQERIVDYQQDVINPHDFFDRADLAGSFEPISRQQGKLATYLDYGTTVNTLNTKPGSRLEVALDQYTGTLITGKFFTALQNHDQATLTFRQAGAAITFSGQDITHAAEHELYDFAYSTATGYDQEILTFLDPGGQHMTCGFARNGILPGLATFSIATEMAQGTRVHVYQFDAVKQEFILIARNVTVGSKGVVTYRDKTMSTYLITTQTLSGAEVSEVVNLQRFDSPDRITWLIPVLIGILLAASAAAWLLARKTRRRKGSAKPAS